MGKTWVVTCSHCFSIPLQPAAASPDCFLRKSWEMAALLSAFCRATTERKGAPFLKHPIQGEMFPTTQRVFLRFAAPWQNSPKTGTAQGLCSTVAVSVHSRCSCSHSTGHTCMSSTVWDKITCKAQMCSPSQENLFWGLFPPLPPVLLINQPIPSQPVLPCKAASHPCLWDYQSPCVSGKNPPGCNRHLTLSPKHGSNWQMGSCRIEQHHKLQRANVNGDHTLEEERELMCSSVTGLDRGSKTKLPSHESC